MSHKSKILAHLQSGKTITPLEALSLYGCLRLSARIYDLRNRGFSIENIQQETKDERYAIYQLSSR
jgi:hypothetical protein